MRTLLESLLRIHLRHRRNPDSRPMIVRTLQAIRAL